MKKFVPALAMLSFLSIGCQTESAPKTTSTDQKTDEPVSHSAAKPVTPEPSDTATVTPKADTEVKKSEDAKPEDTKPEDESKSDKKASE